MFEAINTGLQDEQNLYKKHTGEGATLSLLLSVFKDTIHTGRKTGRGYTGGVTKNGV